MSQKHLNNCYICVYLFQTKEHEKRVILQEQQRASDAETRLSEISRQSEERVACLEAKISEFSDMLGTAERLRSQDQQTIQKLRDRIMQVVMTAHWKLWGVMRVGLSDAWPHMPSFCCTRWHFLFWWPKLPLCSIEALLLLVHLVLAFCCLAADNASSSGFLCQVSVRPWKRFCLVLYGRGQERLWWVCLQVFSTGLYFFLVSAL